MQSWLTIFRSRAAAWMGAALLVQQLIVASSNYWLVRASTLLGAGQDATAFVVAYLGSLVLPYVPGAFAVIWSRRWQLDALARIVTQAERAWFDKPFLWQDRREGERRMAALSKEGPAMTQDVSGMAYQVVGSVLNLVFNIAVIAWVVDGLLLAAFALGALLALAWLATQRKRAARLSIATEDAKLHVTAHIHKMWDNVVLGNTLNCRFWRQGFATRFSDLASRAMRHATFQEASSVGMTILCFLPTLGVASWLMFADRSAAPLSVLVVLPRLFQLMLTCDGLFQLVHEAVSLRARCAFLSPILFQAVAQPDDARIRWDGIATNDSTVKTQGLRRGILDATLGAGRYTVTGANGVGKTSFMLWIKAQVGRAATYVPASHQLLFGEREFVGSTGQRMRLAVEAVLKEEPKGILLLDEWDANLDKGARRSVSDTLDRLAERIPVIEVRHS